MCSAQPTKSTAPKDPREPLEVACGSRSRGHPGPTWTKAGEGRALSQDSDSSYHSLEMLKLMQPSRGLSSHGGDSDSHQALSQTPTGSGAGWPH